MKTVERGVEFLDEKVPGWFNLIDTEKLDIRNSCNCVLGQLYLREHPRIRNESSKTDAFYRKAVELGLGEERYKLDWSAVRAHGFAFGRGKVSNLNAAWSRVITKRQTTSS